MIRFRYFIFAVMLLFGIIFCGFFSYSKNIFFSVCFTLIFGIISVELILRYYFKIKISPLSHKDKFIPFIQEHPYLPFIYKPDSYVPMLPKQSYDFMQEDYSFPLIKTNNRGHLNGENGDRSVSLEKLKNTLRINVLGDSVAANYVRTQEKNYNFSVEIERQLSKFKNTQIEVNNCAIGGYTTLDILVKFLIKDIHENPDFIVINHGYSNLRSYLTNEYFSDNTHFRKSFSIGTVRYKIASYIPFKNSAIYKVFFSPWFPMDIKDFLKFISLDNFVMDADWKGLDYFEYNLKNLIALAIFNKIDVILCTCPHYLHKEISYSKNHQKFHQGMRIQNELIRKIAHDMNVSLVDNEIIVHPAIENFIDSIHLSPIGMVKAARGVADIIETKLRKKKYS